MIREINGEAVNESRELRLKIADTVPGSTIELRVIRNGSGKVVSVKVGDMPEQNAANHADTQVPGKIGIAVEEMNGDVAQELGLPATTRGVVVVEIQPESPAADAGLLEGDVVQEVNREPVRNISEFKNALFHSVTREPLRPHAVHNFGPQFVNPVAAVYDVYDRWYFDNSAKNRRS